MDNLTTLVASFAIPHLPMAFMFVKLLVLKIHLEKYMIINSVTVRERKSFCSEKLGFYRKPLLGHFRKYFLL